jgi:hypothetical protein
MRSRSVHPQKKPEEQTRGEKRDLIRESPDNRPAGWMMAGFRYKGSPGLKSCVGVSYEDISLIARSVRRKTTTC